MNLAKMQEDFLKTITRFGKMSADIHFRNNNVSKREYETMVVIERYSKEHENEKGIYVSHLAKLLRVSQPAVSRMLGILEVKGYIGRDINKEDRRNTYVYLTEAGRQAKLQSEFVMQQLMERIMLRMNEEDMKELIMLWNKLADILEQELKGE